MLFRLKEMLNLNIRVIHWLLKNMNRKQTYLNKQERGVWNKSECNHRRRHCTSSEVMTDGVKNRQKQR